MSIIDRVEVIPFTFTVRDLGLGAHRAMGVSNLRYQKGASLSVMRYAVRLASASRKDRRFSDRRHGVPPV